MNTLQFNKLNMTFLGKIVAMVLLVSVVQFSGEIQILGVLQNYGYKVVPGLAEALSVVNTVYGVQGVFLSYLGVAVAPWFAAIIAGMGAVSM
ncbi:hypothetical protein SAMN05421767_12420 [Granulicatella balaenopterae]|uniref:Uncharacterized protein n=1 Tax=Granulicatella balaenopterae TaxID=137733 RepID=A0A1H9M5Z3_9LACT|nr:hypothetical protein [Granulicatella balaenopterae]SER19180.1 hypothetical protein SAMN05421767_12420 [Granulicatella balaenopterae]